MQGQVSGFGSGLVLLAWIVSLTAAGYYAGEYWLHSLGSEVSAMIGAWLGSIAGLLHVLITLMRRRRVT